MDSKLQVVLQNYIELRAVIERITESPKFNDLRNFLALLAVVRIGYVVSKVFRDYGLVELVRVSYWRTKKWIFDFGKSFPGIREKVEVEIANNHHTIEKALLGNEEDRAKYRKFVSLPPTGLDEHEIMQELDIYSDMTKHHYEEGKTSGAVYNGDRGLTDIVNKAMIKFFWSNPLHPTLFPGVRKMEADVVAMTVNMFNGNSRACGTMTSGGTESILMAVRAHKEWARDVKGITEPNMVVPVTAHAAFDKAADYFGVRIVHIPINPVTCQVDVKKLERAVSMNTIMIVGSCPGFPHGAQDDIEALSRIAIKKNVGLHVDCCLGGFVVPFMNEAGYPIPPFDFRLPGVTSISADPHKYGCAPKGSSIILYRTPELRRYQYFCAPNWPGGVYASPTMAGSRPGNLVVGCWASMVSIGRSGYVQLTKNLVQKTLRMKKAVQRYPELTVFGNPVGSVIAFGSQVIDPYRVGGYLQEKGWDFGWIQFPNGIHISVTALIDVDAFEEDLATAMAQVRKEPSAPATGAAKTYGASTSMPDRSLIDRVSRLFCDTLYTPI